MPILACESRFPVSPAGSGFGGSTFISQSVRDVSAVSNPCSCRCVLALHVACRSSRFAPSGVTESFCFLAAFLAPPLVSVLGRGGGLGISLMS